MADQPEDPIAYKRTDARPEEFIGDVPNRDIRQSELALIPGAALQAGLDSGLYEKVSKREARELEKAAEEAEQPHGRRGRPEDAKE